MAGKKNRKRQSSKKKNTKGSKTEAGTPVKEKKPKLSDESEKRDDDLADKHEPNLETVDKLVKTDNDRVGDLQADENKYVPPFSRKAKRVLKRSGSPVSPAVRPKRSWRGTKQNSKQTKLSESPVDIDDEQSDVVCYKDSPKIEKEEKKEEEIDIVGIDEKITCSQECEDAVVDGTSQTTVANVAIKKDGVCLSSPLLTEQDETQTFVTDVLDDVLEAVCKINQCNSDKTMAESEEGVKKSGEEKDTCIHSETNHGLYPLEDDDVNKYGKEVTTKEGLETSMDTVIKTTSPTKTALGMTTSGEPVIESLTKSNYVANNGSDLAPTYPVNSYVNSSEITFENAKPEDLFRECDKGAIYHADETLQSRKKVEEPCPSSLCEVHNERSKERDSASVPCYNHVTDESQNPEREDFPQMKSAVLPSTTITADKEVPHPINTTTLPLMDKELRSPEGHPAESMQDRKSNLKRGVSDLLKTAEVIVEHTEMTVEANMDMLVSEVPGSGICEDTNLCQGLDQMVPANYQPTFASSLAKTDGKELTREPDHNRIDECFVNDANVCLQNPQLLQDQKANQTDHSQPPAPKIVQSTKEEESTCREEAEPFDSDQASEIYMHQESSTCKEITMDQTVMCVESSVNNIPTSKQMMQKVTKPKPHKALEEKKHPVLSTEMAPGCSSFGSDGDSGDILEFDCLMDCTDSQLVCLDSSTDQLPHYNADIRPQNHTGVAGSNRSKETECNVETVPSDCGMIKGLISELSSLNKFIMGAWKDLENQKKQRQARLKLGKAKKLK